jgi:hypothetical protein
MSSAVPSNPASSRLFGAYVSITGTFYGRRARTSFKLSRITPGHVLIHENSPLSACICVAEAKSSAPARCVRKVVTSAGHDSRGWRYP